MKFLIDADLPNSTVKPFQEKGHESTHVREVDLGSSPDTEVSDYANENNCVLVTRDRDFGNPLLDNIVEEGVIILELHNYAPKKQNKRIADFLENFKEEEIEKGLILLEESRYRIREQKE